MNEEPVVERAPEYRGWRIRSQDQVPGQGMVVTDDWLLKFGFGMPTKENIDRIIMATKAVLAGGYTIGHTDLDREQRQFGSIFQEGGAGRDIEFGEGVGKLFKGGSV